MAVSGPFFRHRQALTGLNTGEVRNEQFRAYLHRVSAGLYS